LRLIVVALVFALTSVFGNLILFVTETYAASITDVTYEKVGSISDCGVIQGGTTDGQYVYSACVNNSSHSNTVIVKTDLSGKKILSSSNFSRKAVGHANAMAYNSKAGKLVLTMWDDDSAGNNGITDQVRIISPSTLKSEGTQTLGKTANVTNICYNPSTDQFIANGKLYDSNYKYIRTIFSGGDGKFNSDSQMSGDTAGQGIGCDNSHVYVIRWSKAKSITRIISYDWSGNLSAVYNLTNMNDELENLFIINGEMYGGVNTFKGNSSNLIKISGITLDTATTIPITVGAFNVLGCNHTSGDVNGRMSLLAQNINTLGYDVVGMSEYDVKECNGKIIEKLAQYGNWQDTKHYSNDNIEQTGIVYNADKVALKSEEVLNTIDGCSTMSNYSRTDGESGNRGGSCYVRIGHFITKGGTEFIVANGHFAMDHSQGGGDMRKKQIESVISKLNSETVPVFIVGDMNAAPPYATSDRAKSYYKRWDHEFYDTLSTAGYQMASQTATQKVNGDWATIGGSERSAYQIDQIFYKNISAPSYFEVFGCKDVSDCGSDHRPVKAIFGTGVAGCGSLTKEQLAQFSAWGLYIYDKSCACSEAGTGTTAGVMSGKNNFEKLATYMSSKGLSKYAVAGILGNWLSESSMSPFINEGGGKNFPNQGYGLVQWSFGRRTKIVEELKTNALTKDSFPTYYSAKYAGRPSVTDWKADGMGEINDVPKEVNDAWLKVEVDYMFSEFPSYKIGAAAYLSTLKQYVPYVNDSDYILDALNSAKSAGDAATILSVVFEIHQGLDPAQNPRAENAEKMLPAVEALVGGGSTSGNCADSSTSTDLSTITLDGIDPSTLPEPKGSGHASWKSSTMDVAKILWHLFPNDFTAFSTRSSGGAVATSCHFQGLAIDMMIANYKDSAVRQRHEAIAEWLMKNREKLGLTNIIYYEKSFNVWGSNTDKPYSEWSSYTNPGGNDDTSAHRDHIHISISPCKS
jgi:endonuclease/exonuclease/phosphatase family metal-dependent hydrolase